ARSIRRFIVEDLSHWYIKLVRRRVWIEEEEWDKITAYYTLYKVLKTLLALSAPFVPFITEEIYQRMFRSAEPNSPESVHMLDWPKFEAELVDEELERNMKIAMEIVESGLAARNKAKIKIRQPLRELIVVSDEPTVAVAVRALGHVISDVVNVKSVRVEPRSELEKYFLVKVEPVMSRLGPVFRGKAAVVAEAIRNLSQEDVSRLLGEGALEVEVEGEKVAVEKDYVKVVKEVKEEWSLEEFSYGVVVLNTVISARERAEGLARDIVRRIQYMRKEMDLPVDAYISVKIAIGPEEMKLLKEFNDYIMYETRAKELDYVDKLEVDEEYYVKKWRIEDIEADIAVKKL
ncbi:MAG: isoleucine--tRNA ligase, partial [Thermoprotei archaeon]